MLRWFLQLVALYAWCREEAAVYGRLRAKQEAIGRTLGPLDMQIAAHAISLGAVLVTRDKAFHQVPDLPSVENWAPTSEIMPRTFSWLDRLHLIARAVANSARSHYDRRDLERLFEVRAAAPIRPAVDGGAAQQFGRPGPPGGTQSPRPTSGSCLCPSSATSSRVRGCQM